MKISTLFILGAVLALSSCEKNQKPTYLKDSATTTSANTNSDAAKTQASNMLLPAGVTSSVPGASQPAAGVQQTAPGTNPPHGQPGHRCDISVGAPLNSPAKSTTSTAAPAGIVPAKSTPDPMAYNVASKPAAAASGKAGLNPAHGEPGHRCDIAVGAPLK